MSKLIYDVGMHDGSDTAYYLAKGFRVVAVEANAKFVDKARRRFESEIADGRLIIVDKAISNQDGTIDFYTSELKDDWSSVLEIYGNRAGDATVSRIPTVSLATLFATYGVPYYLKVDIEGADATVMSALIFEKEKPTFVSAEVHSLDCICALRSAGYDRFKLSNQTMHWNHRPEGGPREGKTIEWAFPPNSSGPFGRELPGKWMNVEDCVDQYLGIWRRIKENTHLFNGWFDVHATTLKELHAGRARNPNAAGRERPGGATAKAQPPEAGQSPEGGGPPAPSLRNLV